MNNTYSLIVFFKYIVQSLNNVYKNVFKLYILTIN